MNLVLRCVFACIACLGFVIVSHSPNPQGTTPVAQDASVSTAAPAMTARVDRGQ